MRVLKSLIFYFLLIQGPNVLAFDSEPLIYEVEANETSLEEVARINHDGIKNRYPKIEDYIEKLKEWNPHLKNLNKIFMGTEVYVDYPYSPNTGHAWAPKIFWAARPTQPRYSLFGFMTTSAGTFTEKVSTVTVTSKQNSPITVGFGGNYPFDDARIWSLNSSFYISYLTGQTTNRAEEVSIDPEVGLNLYLQYAFPGNPLYSIYSGVDVERFSTFNTDDLITGASIDTRTQLLSFATVGFNKIFMPFGKPFLFKASYSFGVSGSSDASGKEFTGDKYMLYLSYKIFSQVMIHALFKHHSLSGPTELAITRYGAGIGWSFR
ncbi:MAG: hypothetical protein EP326_09800 [Deltaproteobacteria bacterium]|nr:MAG: hypothetical protein EP326_09800 [Deltaproteobacteria bacterium]